MNQLQEAALKKAGEETTQMDLRCEACGRVMALEFRIPRLGAPGHCHDFYSCECGYVTSQAHSDSHMLQAAEQEISKVRVRLTSEALKWARLANKVTAPPLPPKLID
jgi:hypothetical protein